MHNLYRDFLFFRLFGASEKPVVLTEGKTDIIYLKLALKALKSKYPDLIQEEDGETRFGVHFQKHSGQVADILNLDGGVSKFVEFINTYKQKVAAYRAWSPSQPVIILTDSDDAVKPILTAASGQSAGEILISSTHNFLHVAHNLYVAKIPLPEGQTQACIEELFSHSLRSTKLDGRSLSLKDTKKHPLKADEYGKVEFAQRVVAKMAKAGDFDNFEVVADSLRGALQHFHSK